MMDIKIFAIATAISKDCRRKAPTISATPLLVIYLTPISHTPTSRNDEKRPPASFTKVSPSKTIHLHEAAISSLISAHTAAKQAVGF